VQREQYRFHVEKSNSLKHIIKDGSWPRFDSAVLPTVVDPPLPALPASLLRYFLLTFGQFAQHFSPPIGWQNFAHARPENRNKTTETTANRKHQAAGATASTTFRTADFPVKPKASHFQKNRGSNARSTRGFVVKAQP